MVYVDFLDSSQWKNGISENSIFNISYISKNSYIRYENGERIPPLDTILAFAKYYGTSIDYIAKNTDVKTPYKIPNS